MTVVCVDQDQSALEALDAMLKELPQIRETFAFRDPPLALTWLENHRAELAVVDPRVPGQESLQLIRDIRQRDPDIAVVILTGDGSFAVEAFALHVSGYVLKPMTPERLKDEVDHALSSAPRRGKEHPRVCVQTFGNFDLKVDGKTVLFGRSKAKELLAYLVDRQGSSITRAEAFAMLWEEGQYSRPMQKQLDVMIRSLRATLRDVGAEEIMEMRNGTMRIRPELLDCDLYRFFEGDAEAVNAYRGEYMSSYSWASLTEAYMDRMNRNSAGFISE